MSCLARKVTSPRSPGPAPTRKHFPGLSGIDFRKNLRRNSLRIGAGRGRHFGLSLFSEELGGQVDLTVHPKRERAYWQIAIPLKQSQELAFGPQTKMARCVIHH